MDYQMFLRSLHEHLRPRTYLEVGVREGGSLSLSRCPSIGIDPGFTIKRELAAPCHVFRTTSDEYFARDRPLAPFDDAPIDLALIDGMHLAEFALRDFINIEKWCHWTGVVVFDDILPRSVDEAARDRHTVSWAGDVYKNVEMLRRLRPDLVVTEVGTHPTGLLIVHALDPDSTVLSEAYADLERECISPDPQDVPDEILSRSRAVNPEELIGSPIWSTIRSARDPGAQRHQGHRQLHRETTDAVASLTIVPPPEVPVAKPYPPHAPAAQPDTASGAPRPRPNPSTPARPPWRREVSRVLRGLDRRIR